MRRQYTENGDLKSVLINTSIFGMLKDCLDNCEDVADVIEGIIMKNT